jgi:ribose 5-phosphate isomerase B
MKIAFGCDHAGVLLKRELIAHVAKRGIITIDMGTDSLEVCNYPRNAKPVADAIVKGEVDLGILICGSGIGISIAANKVDGIRAVVCSEPYSAKLSRQHNNSNILAMGARVVGIELAKMIVDQWLDASFEGGIHQERIDLIAAIERGEAI